MQAYHALTGTETSSNVLDNAFIMYANNNGVKSVGIGTGIKVADNITVSGNGAVSESGNASAQLHLVVDF